MIKTLEKIIRSIAITGAATLLTASASFAQDFTEQELTWFKNRWVSIEYAKKLYEIKNPDGTRLYDAKQIIDARDANVKIEYALELSVERDEEGKPLFFPSEIAEFAKLGITPEYFRQFRAIRDENGPLFNEHDIMDAWTWKIKADEIREYALELAKIKDKKGYPMFRRNIIGSGDEICRAWARKLDINYARELSEYTDKDGNPVFTTSYEIFSAYKTGLDLKKDKEYLEGLLSIRNSQGKRAFNGGDLIGAKEIGLEAEYAILMNSIQTNGTTVFNAYFIRDAKEKEVAYEYAKEIAAIRRSDKSPLTEEAFMIIDYSTLKMPVEYARALAALNNSQGKPLLTGYEVRKAFKTKFSVEEVKEKAGEIEEYNKEQHFEDYFTETRRKK